LVLLGGEVELSRVHPGERKLQPRDVGPRRGNENGAADDVTLSRDRAN
jgi:hypothetical protein